MAVGETNKFAIEMGSHCDHIGPRPVEAIQSCKQCCDVCALRQGRQPGSSRIQLLDGMKGGQFLARAGTNQGFFSGISMHAAIQPHAMAGPPVNQAARVTTRR